MRCVIKQEFKFEDNKTSLENNRTTLRTQQMFRGEAHNLLLSEKVKKIALHLIVNWGKIYAFSEYFWFFWEKLVYGTYLNMIYTESNNLVIPKEILVKNSYFQTI